MFFLIVFNYQNPGWFSPILFRPEMFRTSMFRTCLEAKHLTVFRYFSRVIILLKLIINYTRIEICLKRKIQKKNPIETVLAFMHAPPG